MCIISILIGIKCLVLVTILGIVTFQPQQPIEEWGTQWSNMFKRVDKVLLGSIFKHPFVLRSIVLHSKHKASGGYMFLEILHFSLSSWWGLILLHKGEYFLYGFLEIPYVLWILDEGLKSNRPLFQILSKEGNFFYESFCKQKQIWINIYYILSLVLVNYHCWAIIKNRNRPLVVFRVALKIHNYGFQKIKEPVLIYNRNSQKKIK